MICEVVVSSNSIITVTWNYNRTGGLPLTNISVSVTKQVEGLIISHSTPIAVNQIDATSVEVPNLEVGFEYVFIITAVNANGSSSIVCGPTLYVACE